MARTVNYSTVFSTAQRSAAQCNTVQYSDLNPLDFCIWSVLQAKVYERPPETIDGLRNRIKRKFGTILILTS